MIASFSHVFAFAAGVAVGGLAAMLLLILHSP
jgi:hypothetical protein